MFLLSRRLGVVYIPAIVDVLSIPPKGDTRSLTDPCVDGIQGVVSERVHKDLETGKRLAIARLQCQAVARRLDVEDRNGGEHSVGVDTGAPGIEDEVRVGYEILSVPVGLHEAENIGCLITSRASFFKLGCELGALDQRFVLVLCGEICGTVHLFPQVKTSSVPESLLALEMLKSRCMRWLLTSTARCRTGHFE